MYYFFSFLIILRSYFHKIQAKLPLVQNLKNITCINYLGISYYVVHLPSTLLFPYPSKFKFSSPHHLSPACYPTTFRNWACLRVWFIYQVIEAESPPPISDQIPITSQTSDSGGISWSLPSLPPSWNFL